MSQKICQRVRPTPTNPTNLFDLYVDQNIQTLSGNNFLLYDSGSGINRIVIFSTAENRKIISFSKIWMADGKFDKFIFTPGKSYQDSWTTW